MKFVIDDTVTKIILKESTREEFNQLKLYLNRHLKNYVFMAKYKLTKFSANPWDGKYEQFHGGYIDFGLLHECYKCCKEYGYPFEILNKEKIPINREIKKEDVENFCKEFYKDHKDEHDINKVFVPYEHQEESIFRILKHQYGRIEVATAGGKSLIFGSLIFYYLTHINPDAKFLLIVPTMDLVTQFYNDINNYNYGYHNENKNVINIRMDEIMSDKPRKYHGDEPNIYIGTYQSLVKLPVDWFHQFDVVCCDECLHPDTLITMSDGKKKKIKDIKIGDKIFTINEKTLKKEIREVDYVYKNLSKNQQMFELEMEDGKKLKITGNHEVILSNGKRKRIDKLSTNDEIFDFNI
jgi:protein-tyrosine phosphatase